MSGDHLVSEHGVAVSLFLSRVCANADPDSYSGKRDTTRFSEGVSLEVILDPKKPTRISNVYMHNASQGGCAFWAKKKIEPRTPVRLRAYTEEGEDPWIETSVTHCTVGIRGFMVGVAFDV